MVMSRFLLDVCRNSCSEAGSFLIISLILFIWLVLKHNERKECGDPRVDFGSRVMLVKLIHKLFGTKNDRIIKRLYEQVKQINKLESTVQQYSDEQLRTKTVEFKQLYQQGVSLDKILPEAFAVVREASLRTIGLRHFDVQLIGGMVLHSGKIAEMRTGEGKTLVATLAAYLNALSGEAVHVITVNDYLARRDAEWMGPIYRFLGLSVGVIVAGQSPEEKQAAYQADVVYGTNNEFGFDYLRDNMVFRLQDKVQRGLAFAIIDEVDSILIDEARTPLIISGMSDDVSGIYTTVNTFIPKLQKQRLETVDNPIAEEEIGDYTVDEKERQAYFTERGYQRVEQMAIEVGLLPPGDNLYAAQNILLMHYLSAALRAHTLFQRDVDYIVRNNEVIIVDEHTGRTMEGRRWSDGLHQAVEAKEGVPINRENQTLASITFQNYFRLYKKLSGMTGTADTEAYELDQIYHLEVVVIPTNKPMIREDLPDQIYLNSAAKFQAILRDIDERHRRGQPILVGTASIENSELLSEMLTKVGISHQVLNAKQPEREARIIANAGRPGAITIATNMAGRGTDILLGGNLSAELQNLDEQVSAAREAVNLLADGDSNEDRSQLAMLAEQAEQYTEEWIAAERQRLQQEWQGRHDQVLALGGLHVIGSERHESRRIDNQLRGRAGRQGDPGSSRFYLSLDDHLLRIFAYDKLSSLMRKLGMQENEAIEHRLVNKAVENAQRKVEGHNFDIRKNLLEYDDIANEQRKVIYQQRDELMGTEAMRSTVEAIRQDVTDGLLDYLLDSYGPDVEQWDMSELVELFAQRLSVTLPVQQWLDEAGTGHIWTEDELRSKIHAFLISLFEVKWQSLSDELINDVERTVVLQVLDELWKEHLAAMDYLRDGIHLRGYAQQNPVQEYKRESFYMFERLLNNIKQQSLQRLYSLQLHSDQQAYELEEAQQQSSTVFSYNRQAESEEVEESIAKEVLPNESLKVGRNSLCPCGSGRKFKHCHGKLS